MSWHIEAEKIVQRERKNAQTQTLARVRTAIEQKKKKNANVKLPFTNPFDAIVSQECVVIGFVAQLARTGANASSECREQTSQRKHLHRACSARDANLLQWQ
jgi:membrane-bound lytic murein transglycosylase